jgi:hypothetical protein
LPDEADFSDIARFYDTKWEEIIIEHSFMSRERQRLVGVVDPQS